MLLRTRRLPSLALVGMVTSIRVPPRVEAAPVTLAMVWVSKTFVNQISLLDVEKLPPSMTSVPPMSKVPDTLSMKGLVADAAP